MYPAPLQLVEFTRRLLDGLPAMDSRPPLSFNLQTKSQQTGPHELRPTGDRWTLADLIAMIGYDVLSVEKKSLSASDARNSEEYAMATRSKEFPRHHLSQRKQER